MSYNLYVLGTSLEYIEKPSLRRVSEAITAKSSPAMASTVLKNIKENTNLKTSTL